MPKQRSKILYALTDLDYPIILMQEGQDSFSVVYGLEVKNNLSYAAAKEEFADVFFHALALAGRIDQ